MIDFLDKIKNAIMSPNEIREDSRYDHTNNYYHLHLDKEIRYLGKIIVVSVNSRTGNIKTAFSVNNYKHHGKTLYKK